MDCHAGVDTKRRAQLRRRQSLLVEPVPRFVNGTEQRVEGLMLVAARRHPHIAPSTRAERMQRHVDPAARVVETEPLRHLVQKGPLRIDRKSPQAGRHLARAGSGASPISRINGTRSRLSSPNNRSTATAVSGSCLSSMQS